jgi:hypothetical protein
MLKNDWKELSINKNECLAVEERKKKKKKRASWGLRVL